MDAVFDLSMQILLSLADLFGTSYKAINVWTFVIIWPLFRGSRQISSRLPVGAAVVLPHLGWGQQWNCCPNGAKKRELILRPLLTFCLIAIVLVQYAKIKRLKAPLRTLHRKQRTEA